MNTEQLNTLLSRWCDGLDVVSNTITKDVRALCGVMSRFGGQSVGDFVKFLEQCDEYKRTGVVGSGRKTAAPKKLPATPVSIPAVVESLRLAIHPSNIDNGKLESVLQGVGKLTTAEVQQLISEFGIVGKMKSKAEGINKLRAVLENQAEASSRVQTMRDDR